MAGEGRWDEEEEERKEWGIETKGTREMTDQGGRWRWMERQYGDKREE